MTLMADNSHKSEAEKLNRKLSYPKEASNTVKGGDGGAASNIFLGPGKHDNISKRRSG